MKTDQRKHKRFPVVKDMAEPVDLFLMDGPVKELPAVMTNISSGGMSLVVFAHVHGETKLKLSLSIPGLEGIEIEGRVAWTHPKGETTTVGVQFVQISTENTRRINKMAESYQDCELKLSFGLRDVCFRNCAFWPLCAKPVKLKH